MKQNITPSRNSKGCDGDGIPTNPDHDIGIACDLFLQGWADWEWKSFEAGPQHGTHSQYNEFGTGKTGHGCDWNRPANMSTMKKNSRSQDSYHPPPYYFTTLARTYAPRVAGRHLAMRFNVTTGAFRLEYEVAVNSELPTEIYLLPERYGSQGADVRVAVSHGEGTVRMEYAPGASWLKLYPGEGGLTPGARVAVDIGKKGTPASSGTNPSSSATRTSGTMTLSTGALLGRTKAGLRLETTGSDSGTSNYGGADGGSVSGSEEVVVVETEIVV